MHRFCWFIALASVLCGALPRSWRMYQNSPDHDAVFAGGSAPHRWQRDVGAKINGGLAVSANRLFVETFAPSVAALDRRDGREIWDTPMPDVVMTTPIVAGGLVVVGTGRDGVLEETPRRTIWGRPQGDEIVALDERTGAVRWRYHTIGEDMPSPALVDARGRSAIVFANGDDHARALDVRSGRLLWSVRVDGVATMSSANASGGVVYVDAGPPASAHRPSHVYAFRAADGARLWSAPYGNADVSPVLGRDVVVVEDAQTGAAPGAGAFNDVEALDAGSGRLRWSYRSPRGAFSRVGSSEEAVAGTIDRGVLLQSLPAASRFAAFDLESGRLLWSAPTRAAVKMSALAWHGRVFVGDTSGEWYVFDERSGRIVSRERFARPFTCSSPVIVGSTLYVADWDEIYARPAKWTVSRTKREERRQ